MVLDKGTRNKGIATDVLQYTKVHQNRLKEFLIGLCIYSDEPIFKDSNVLDDIICNAKEEDVNRFIAKLIVRYRQPFHFELYEKYTEGLLSYLRFTEMYNGLNVIENNFTNPELYMRAKIDPIMFYNDSNDKRKFKFIACVHKSYSTSDIGVIAYMVNHIANMIGIDNLDKMATVEKLVILDITQQFKSHFKVVW